MHDFLTDYHSRLEAFRTGALSDLSAVAAPLFPQPVALTERLAAALPDDDARLELIRTAHQGLTAVAGPQPVKERATFDFGVMGLELRFLLTFARSRSFG